MKTKLYRYYLIIIAALLTVNSAFSLLDNKGKDFIMAFLPNFTSPTVELHLTSDVATTVTVEYPLNSPSFVLPVAVNPGSITIVNVPAASAQSWSANNVLNNCVHAYANDEFVCYMVNRAPATSDAALALPVEILNTEYIAVTYYAVLFNNVDSEIAIFAAYDNTTVTITPSNNMVGHPAGVPFNVVLNKGEGYFNTGLVAGAAGDLTGTIITSTKPIGLTNGNNCANIPLGTAYCDHIFEMAQPTQTWGKKAMAANLPHRGEGSVYRIVASQDNTNISLDGVFQATINKGAFIETNIIPGNHVFDANNPIFVTQFMTGVTRPLTDNLGDPAQGNVIPAEQYLSNYTFSTVGNNQFVENFVTIIAENADVGVSMQLDGSTIPAGNFSPIPGTNYSAAVLQIGSGTHTTSSAGKHGITVEGLNLADSYLYPGGGLFQFINPVGDANPPVCGQVSVSNLVAYGSATDNKPSEDVNNNSILDPGEDLNGNNQIDVDKGIFFVDLDPSSTNLALTVNPFTPGDGSVSYSVSLINNAIDGQGAVIVTDGAGNTCSSAILIVANHTPVANAGSDASYECDGSQFTLDGSGSTDDDSDPLTYTWSENNVVIAGPTSSATSQVNLSVGSHTITLKVEDPDGASSTDDVVITVTDTQGPTINLAASATMWSPNHQYVTFNMSDMVSSVTDACEGQLAVSSVKITSATSDEVEDANGNGDGNTKKDIVIDCSWNKVYLRSEREGNGNGRVYKVNLKVTDVNNNSSTAVYKVTVPKNQGNGSNAVDDGVKYSVNTCGMPKAGDYADGSMFELYQNSPNPSNPSTEISFSLEAEGFVTLNIYNSMGQLVRTLVSSSVSSGYHAVQWDGTDSNGNAVGSGFYIYEINTNGASLQKTMMLVR